MPNLDAAKRFQAVMNTGKDARSILELLLNRELRGRTSGLTDLRRLATKAGVPIKHVREVALRLQKAGLGNIIHAQKSNEPDRFKWKVPLRDIKAGLSDEDVAAAIEPAIKIPNASHLASSHLTVTIPTQRRGISINLPSDVSRAEIEAIADALKRFGL
jgi:hypothetical protein